MYTSPETSSVIDYFESEGSPKQADVPTLNMRLDLTETKIIEAPAPKILTPSVAERIEIARKQPGKKMIRLFNAGEVNELSTILSGEDMRAHHWQVITDDEGTKHVLRTTALHFENKVKRSDKIEDMMHHERPKAISGNFAELEDRLSRMSLTENLKVRLPRPGKPVDWAGLRELQEAYGNRVIFLAHKEHRSTEYGTLPVFIFEDMHNKKVDVTQEMPSLKVMDPKKVQETNTGLRGMLSKGLSRLGNGLRSLWGRKASSAE